MDGAIQVIGADSVEWADDMAIVPVELHADSWRAALFCGFRAVIYPRTVIDDVNDGRIINKVDTTTLANCDAGLCEIVIRHMNCSCVAATCGVVAPGGSTAAGGSAATGHKQCR